MKLPPVSKIIEPGEMGTFMNLKRILSLPFSNKLLVLIVISSLALIAATVAFYLVFPSRYQIEDQESGTTILAILVGIYVLFFAAMQILYSVNDIPREPLHKYSLLAKESKLLVAYFLIATMICGFIVLLHPIAHSEYLLFLALVLALFIITCYFFWFTKRITAQGILSQITWRMEKTLVKINKLEEISGPEFSDFHNFIRKSDGRYRYEVAYCVYDSLFQGKEPSFTILAKEQRDTMIGKINVQEIEKRLSRIISDPHVKLIFEVEPTLPIPKKDPYENMVRNYRLLTIVFEEDKKSEQENFEAAQKEFVEKVEGATRGGGQNGQKVDTSAEVGRILKKFGTGVEHWFEQKDYSRWETKAENALDDLKAMFDYNLKREQVVDLLCSALGEIIGHQFIDLKSEVFLHVRYRLFRKIGEMYKEIYETSLRQDDVRFFDEMLPLFYKLASTAAERRNPLIYDEVLKAIRFFHLLFVRTAPHAYNSAVEILVLNIRELTTSIPRGHFETEEDLNELDRFYNTIFQKGVDTAFEVVKDYLNWYNEDKLHHQIYLKEQIQLLIDFMPYYKDRPQDYFSDPLEFFKIKQEIAESVPTKNNSKFKLATKKAEIVKDLMVRLHRRIMQLSIYMVALYKEKELDADLIWKIALPAAKSSRYGHGLQSFFTRLFNDYMFERDTQDLFRWRDIHPAGAHELLGFNLNIFWIIFNVYLGKNDFFPTKAEELSIRGLEETIESIDENLWAQALNMSLEEFNERKKQYHKFAKKIKVITR